MVTSKAILLVALVSIAAIAPSALGARRLLQTSTGSTVATVYWDEPDDDDVRLSDVSVAVGDNLTFVWNEDEDGDDDDDDDDSHDVWEISSLTCPTTFANGTGITQLAPSSATGNLTIQFPTAVTRYFTSSVDDDCSEGLLLAVSVGGSSISSPYTASAPQSGGDNDGDDDDDDDDK